MFLKQRRVRTLMPRIGHLQIGTELTVGISELFRHATALSQIGFTPGMEIGETVLPSPSFGPKSMFNANGMFLVHKELPMEIAYRQIEWHWKQWAGRYHTVDKSKIVDVRYKRYPRTFVPPTSIELQIAQSPTGEKIVIGPKIKFQGNEERLLPMVNLFLEIFGECQILLNNYESLVVGIPKRLNWNILPPGKRPWEQLKKEIQPIVDFVKPGNQAVTTYRLKAINKLQPDFTAIGMAGFSGYIVLGFPSKNTYILENLHYGNATYIFEDNWEALSQKTKEEILTQGLHKRRIIHSANWEEEFEKAAR